MTPIRSSEGHVARRESLRWALAVFALALLVRALELWELSGTVFFETLMGDGRNYHIRAQQIAAGDWIGSEVFYQAPGYTYFLALVYTAFGDELIAVRIVQVVLGAGSCALLTLAGWRLFSKPVGIASGLLLALYAPAIFFDSAIQKSALDVFFVCLVLWTIAGIEARPRVAACLGLGATIGLLVLSRENAMVFVPVLGAWLLLRPGQPARRRAATTVALLAGLACVLLPVALRNLHVGGEFHLTTSQFGHNFYIGNNEAADGIYTPLLARRGDPRVEQQDAIELAEQLSGRSLGPAEVSSFYTQRALDYISSHPGDWALLMARKAQLVFNAVELVDTKDQYSHEEESWVLWASGSLLHFGVLAPLALLGVWLTWPERGRLWPLYLLFLAYLGAVLIFYVFARYRMPLVPFLVLFAAAGIVGFGPCARAGPRRRLVLPVLVTVAMAVFCNWPVVDRDNMRSVTHYNIANELVASERIEEAIRHYERAIDVYAGNAMANHNLGAVLAGQGDLALARRHFETAVRIAPDYVQAWFNLARARMGLGDLEGALASYQRGLQLAPQRADIHAEIGWVALDVGDRERAIQSFERALQIDPSLAEARRGLDATPGLGE